MIYFKTQLKCLVTDLGGNSFRFLSKFKWQMHSIDPHTYSRIQLTLQTL